MEPLTYDRLAEALAPGGASVLTSRTELTPAAGETAGVAPARYITPGNKATFAFETRFEGGEAVPTVVLDSKGSSINRVEDAIVRAIEAGDDLMCRTPRIQVQYQGLPPVTCLELPHRAWDGHIRAGSVDGASVTQHATYREARDCSHANARALLELSPASLAFGSWDSTRKSHQGRYRSALVGEVIGLLADPERPSRDEPKGAARFDTVAPSVRLGAADMQKLLDNQRDELSQNNIDKIEKAINNTKKATTSAAGLGLGAIPPTLDGLGVVACRRIIRHHVLSFSALRQLRFGLGADGDVAARALLAAWALSGLARSDAELAFRANCDLREAGPSDVILDQRYGQTLDLEPISIDVADRALQTAIETAEKHGIRWSGQIFEVTGSPIVAGGIDADSDDGAM